MIAALELTIGLAVLILGSDLLIRGSAAIANRLQVPHLIVGLTIVAFGTSAPELVVSLDAALAGAGGIAVGNIVGSNIANILVVLGLPAVIRSIDCQANGTMRNLIFMIFVTLVFLAMCWDRALTRLDGFVLLALFAAFTVDQIARARRYRRTMAGAKSGTGRGGNMWIASAYAVIGLVSLPLAADAVVKGALGIAGLLSVSQTAVGVTIVALGTSLPEVAASVMAARRGHSAMAIGNAIGSNIFNILAIMGITAAVVPIAVPGDFFTFEIWMMVAAAFFLVPFVTRCWPIGRLTGTVMTIAYAATVAAILSSPDDATNQPAVNRAELPTLR